VPLCITLQGTFEAILRLQPLIHAGRLALFDHSLFSALFSTVAFLHAKQRDRWLTWYDLYDWNDYIDYVLRWLPFDTVHSINLPFAVRSTQVTREAHFQVAREGPLGAIHEAGASVWPVWPKA
jgi:hypothetical protein